MTLITDFETFCQYRADRIAKGQQIVTEFLFDALKNAEEVTNPDIIQDPTKPAYIIRIK